MSREVDVEKPYNKTEVVAKLRRLADALEQEKAFEIQIAGHRVYLPAKAAVTVEFEYERSDTEEEIEIEVSWTKG